ncbi:polysaccharide deacetylase family protein [Lysobacter maris]|uniref:Polysaccharide deacetylase family protein n=1 Tax=Marilutibacter maris TaxID=1605891 RepID=A0A508B0I9_9GAMM|nr:polysaccharide deacetylase family protein [Lysobacter maris]KAB8198368.1 polysaccharide deacetylase family protein [Lysobacter maris]
MSTENSPSRRDFLHTVAGAGLAAGTLALGSGLAAAPAAAALPRESGRFWPNGARLVLSVSMQFEAGGEPDAGADSPFSGNPLPAGVPDLPARTWFQYGYREGIPRLLDLWDKHGIKVTSHMVGTAVRTSPELAREIVRRGHEAAAHGMSWTPQHGMSREQERAFIREGVEIVERVTGQRPRGYNCNWLRRSPNTLSLLQELGFSYHIDDLSRDEPFVVPVDGRDFVVVPYTLDCNDIVLIEGSKFSSRQFFEQLKDAFDQLYAEAGDRRRMMSISTHDRIGGRPAVVKALDDFLAYALARPGVAAARKDEIARWALVDAGTRREAEAT